MKTLTIMLAGLSFAAAALPATAANAQRWENINARQTRLDARIDQGVRSGGLTRPEAMRLRSDFRGLVSLESRYRRSGGGLDMRERADLNRRFDGLSARIRFERHDRQDRRGRR